MAEESARENREGLIPSGYRHGVVTAITVFLGFSLAFLRYWSLEKEGPWTKGSIVSEFLVGIGTVIQFIALFRSLDVRDEEFVRYKKTVSVFLAGVIVVGIGVVLSVIVSVQ